MKQRILNYFQPRQEIPLIYFETGFSIWGIPGTMRPSQIRGYHFCPNNSNSIEQGPVLEPNDGNFVSSIDVSNMFSNLGKSSFMLLQWLRTDQILFNELTHWANFRDEVIKEYDFKSVSYQCTKSAQSVYLMRDHLRENECCNILYVIHKIITAELSFEGILPEQRIIDLLEQYDRDPALVELGKVCINLFLQDGLGRIPLREEQYKTVLDRHVLRISTRESYMDVRNENLEQILDGYFKGIKSKYSQQH